MHSVKVYILRISVKIKKLLICHLHNLTSATTIPSMTMTMSSPMTVSMSTIMTMSMSSSSVLEHKNTNLQKNCVQKIKIALLNLQNYQHLLF